jgi:hypothetical protein
MYEWTSPVQNFPNSLHLHFAAALLITWCSMDIGIRTKGNVL